MIVPRDRLIFTTGVLLPVLAMGALVPAFTAVAVGLCALAVLAALVDLLVGAQISRTLRVEIPETIRLARNRPGEIALTLQRTDTTADRVRIGIPLPRSFDTEHEELEIALPEGAPRVTTALPCTARERGAYPIRQLHIERPSPLGFWSSRHAQDTASEIRVYPNLMGERRRLASVFLHRGQFGIHAQRRVGQGRDFEQLRDYLPGDSFEDIHWKATARHGRPFTRLYQVERTQEVYLIIDASRLSDRLAGADRLLDRYISAALVLGLAAEQQGDLFGLTTFSDKPHAFVRARNGKAHYAACRDALYTLMSQSVSPDFPGLFSFLRTRLRKRALLVFLTDLRDPVIAEQFITHVPVLARQHLVLANVAQVPGVEPLFSHTIAADESQLQSAFANHLAWTRHQSTAAALHRLGVTLTQLTNDGMAAQLLEQYMTVKQRQQL